MKKVILSAVLLVSATLGMTAQDSGFEKGVNDVYEKSKTGSFLVEAGIGFPMGDAADAFNFNFGANVAYLFNLMDNLDVGFLSGLQYYTGEESNGFKVDDQGFLLLSATGRYYFADKKIFGALDTGFAINVINGDYKADGGLYWRPKVGYNLNETVGFVASFATIHSDDNINTLNLGVEFNF